MIASIKGTKTKRIVEVLNQIPLDIRLKVKEVTLDMARNMEASVRDVFPNCILVTDRFHVVKFVIDALQHIRIKLRWEALEAENIAIGLAKET